MQTRRFERIEKFITPPVTGPAAKGMGRQEVKARRPEDSDPVCAQEPRARVLGFRQTSSTDRAGDLPIAGPSEEYAPVCDHEPRPRYLPGPYEAQCTRAFSYLEKRWGCWTCVLEFALYPDHELIACFLRLDNSKQPLGPRSRYVEAWAIANGGPPKRHDRMSPRIFLNKWFEIDVNNVRRKADGTDLADFEVYSRITRIVRRISEPFIPELKTKQESTYFIQQPPAPYPTTRFEDGKLLSDKEVEKTFDRS